jgi:hypothetical protein
VETAEVTVALVLLIASLYAMLWFLVLVIALFLVQAPPGARGRGYELFVLIAVGCVMLGYWTSFRMLWDHCHIGWWFGVVTSVVVYAIVFVV